MRSRGAFHFLFFYLALSFATSIPSLFRVGVAGWVVLLASSFDVAMLCVTMCRSWCLPGFGAIGRDEEGGMAREREREQEREQENSSGDRLID